MKHEHDGIGSAFDNDGQALEASLGFADEVQSMSPTTNAECGEMRVAKYTIKDAIPLTVNNVILEHSEGTESRAKRTKTQSTRRSLATSLEKQLGSSEGECTSGRSDTLQQPFGVNVPSRRVKVQAGADSMRLIAVTSIACSPSTSHSRTASYVEGYVSSVSSGSVKVKRRKRKHIVEKVSDIDDDDKDVAFFHSKLYQGNQANQARKRRANGVKSVN